MSLQQQRHRLKKRPARIGQRRSEAVALTAIHRMKAENYRRSEVPEISPRIGGVDRKSLLESGMIARFCQSLETPCIWALNDSRGREGGKRSTDMLALRCEGFSKNLMRLPGFVI